METWSAILICQFGDSSWVTQQRKPITDSITAFSFNFPYTFKWKKSHKLQRLMKISSIIKLKCFIYSKRHSLFAIIKMFAFEENATIFLLFASSLIYCELREKILKANIISFFIIFAFVINERINDLKIW